METLELSLAPFMGGLPGKLKEMIATIDTEAVDYPDRQHHIKTIHERIAGGRLDYAEHWAKEVIGRQQTLREIARACGRPIDGISASMIAATPQVTHSAAADIMPDAVPFTPEEAPEPTRAAARIASFDVHFTDDDNPKLRHADAVAAVNDRITKNGLDIVNVETLSEPVFLGLGVRQIGLRVWHRIS